MTGDAAWERFWKSTHITYEAWHEGIGYDLDALGEMTSEEREQVVTDLRTRPQGWREVEVYGAIATAAARAALRDTLLASNSDTRLQAAAKLRELGEDVDVASILASELTRVTIGDGLTTALRLVEQMPTPELQRVLLKETRRPEVGVHYAAMLCFLTGVTKSSFDWKMRPFFLRFGEHASEPERQSAFEELCRLTGLSLDASAMDDNDCN